MLRLVLLIALPCSAVAACERHGPVNCPIPGPAAVRIQRAPRFPCHACLVCCAAVPCAPVCGLAHCRGPFGMCARPRTASISLPQHLPSRTPCAPWPHRVCCASPLAVTCAVVQLTPSPPSTAGRAGCFAVIMAVRDCLVHWFEWSGAPLGKRRPGWLVECACGRVPFSCRTFTGSPTALDTLAIPRLSSDDMTSTAYVYIADI